jgi:hypothetical protein
MNRQAFFNALRGGFTGALEPQEVTGTEAILDAMAGLPLAFVAYALATAWHETAGTMQPIKERGGTSYFFSRYDPKGPRPDLGVHVRDYLRTGDAERRAHFQAGSANQRLCGTAGADRRQCDVPGRAGEGRSGGRKMKRDTLSEQLPRALAPPTPSPIPGDRETARTASNKTALKAREERGARSPGLSRTVACRRLIIARPRSTQRARVKFRGIAHKGAK